MQQEQPKERVTFEFNRKETTANLNNFGDEVTLVFDIDSGERGITKVRSVKDDSEWEVPVNPKPDQRKLKEAQDIAKSVASNLDGWGAAIARLFTRKPRLLTVEGLKIGKEKGAFTATMTVTPAADVNADEIYSNMQKILVREGGKFHDSDAAVRHGRPQGLMEADGDVIEVLPKEAEQINITRTLPSAADAADNRLRKYFRPGGESHGR